MSTGNGTGSTVTFTSGTGDWVGEILSFDIDGEEVTVIDMAHMLSTGYREKDFGLLIEPPAIAVQINYDPANPPPLGVRDTATATWPDGSTLIGSGAFTARSSSTPLEDKMTGSFTFQFDGRTGPTYA